MMKKLLAALLCLFLLAGFSGCGQTSVHDVTVKKAIDLVVAAWGEEYENHPVETSKQIQIKNTRLVVFRENSQQQLQDILYVVEFVIFTDYYGTAPYCVQVNRHNNVLVYRDGTMEVTENFLQSYFARTYKYPTEYMEEIIDLEDAYNGAHSVRR